VVSYMVIHIRQIICTAAYTSHTRHRCGTGTQRLRAPKSRRLCRSSRASKIPSNSVPIEITYPGTGNYSTFTYDPFWRNVSIVETTGGSISSTKQFIWCQDKMRPYQACEARNAAGAVTAQYFTHGEVLSGTDYFYTADHLANSPNFASKFHQNIAGLGGIFSPTFTSSIREMTNSAGFIQAQVSYDPFGRAVSLQGSIQPDYQFGDYYLHKPSGLSLTLSRAYSSNQGRFISRDMISESGGINVYAYMNNHPVIGVDPTGRCAIAVGALLGALGSGEAAAFGAAAAGAVVGIAWSAGQIVGNAMNRARSEHCQEVHDECVEDCSTTPPLGTRDKCNQGNPFNRCVNDCMRLNGCL
jgi:RHS repeat-associated protein